MRRQYSSPISNREQNNMVIGIKLLIEHYKRIYRIPENLNHYSEEDYQEAEKKFVKYCIVNGRR
jgi:hypothetical protein